MNIYDDFAVNPASFEVMAKEFCKQKNLAVQSADDRDVSKSGQKKLYMATLDEQKQVKNKVEYLLVLVKDLKTRTSNNDVLIVLNNLQSEIENQQHILDDIFQITSEQSSKKADINMFCNNLKIALNTTSDIVKLLIKLKDSDETSFEQKQMLTESINAFLDINNNLVSLFVECQYLLYKSR